MQKLSTLRKLLQTRSWKSIRKKVKKRCTNKPMHRLRKMFTQLDVTDKIYSNQIDPEITDLFLENKIPMWPLITARHRPNIPLFRFANALYLCAPKSCTKTPPVQTIPG